MCPSACQDNVDYDDGEGDEDDKRFNVILYSADVNVSFTT